MTWEERSGSEQNRKFDWAKAFGPEPSTPAPSGCDVSWSDRAGSQLRGWTFYTDIHLYDKLVCLLSTSSSNHNGKIIQQNEPIKRQNFLDKDWFFVAPIKMSGKFSKIDLTYFNFAEQWILFDNIPPRVKIIDVNLFALSVLALPVTCGTVVFLQQLTRILTWTESDSHWLKHHLIFKKTFCRLSFVPL